MHCERWRWNWAGANPRSARSIGTWARRGPRWRGGRTSRPWWRMSRWGKWARCLRLEVSRLARSNLDWHRLLELCALTATLVIDEDGCYDPADFNDGLLLGLKGTMAQAELHFLHARLQGGKLNKAKKGELRFPASGRLLLRRARPHHPGRRCRSAGRGGIGVSPLSRNGQRLCGRCIDSRKAGYAFPSEPTAGRGMARLYGVG